MTVDTLNSPEQLGLPVVTESASLDTIEPSADIPDGEEKHAVIEEIDVLPNEAPTQSDAKAPVESVEELHKKLSYYLNLHQKLAQFVETESGLQKLLHDFHTIVVGDGVFAEKLSCCSKPIDRWPKASQPSSSK